MMDEFKRQQVCNILLTPIQCEKHSGFNDERKIEVGKRGNIINTTQTYWPEYKDRDTGNPFRYKFTPDCDMSDFACGFYEIIYRDIFKGNVVDSNGCLSNKCFAGDTMTSISKLSGLRDKYHCLANFWLVPMELGRKSNHKLSKTSRYYRIDDYMDRFLLLLKYEFSEFKEEFHEYFSDIDNFTKLVDIHMLCESYLDKNYCILQYSDVINKETEKYLWECIKKRAEVISESKYALQLYEYFEKNGIL